MLVLHISHECFALFVVVALLHLRPLRITYALNPVEGLIVETSVL